MTSEERQVIDQEIQFCEAALRGETINGVKIGDAGITKEWVERTLASLRQMAVRGHGLFSYRYESRYRPLWMGFDRSLKACGFSGEWKLIEDNGRRFTIATDCPLPSEARRQLELTPA